MERYAPNAEGPGDRDVVSRAMDHRDQGRPRLRPGRDYVLLKLDHLGAEVINKRLPGIREIAIKFANVDPIKEPIPVVPTVPLPDGRHSDQLPRPGRGARGHGGHEAIVPGFYAAGECACVSVHGANRLGTNSLLDLLVFGKSAGEQMVEDMPRDAARTARPAGGRGRADAGAPGAARRRD